MISQKSESTPCTVLIRVFGEAGTDISREIAAALPEADSARLAAWFVDFAGRDPDRRAALATAIGQAARQLAPEDQPPAEPGEAMAWQALLEAAESLHEAGAKALGRPAFISDLLLEQLLMEARRERPESTENKRATGSAGAVLAGLAVSRQLREAVSKALGVAVVPTYDALYEYDPPCSHTGTHLDAPGFEFTFHLQLEKTGAGPASVLIVHEAGQAAPRRLRIQTGDGVVIAGRGTIHSWAPLGADESRILTAIGFKRA